ncbi:hypothetical protein HK096_003523 [Nowakowskiella sp. JEL0078]|nr:hypothetical protein HK096_003523 [Nowakowskiella sp. JEL0078]
MAASSPAGVLSSLAATLQGATIPASPDAPSPTVVLATTRASLAAVVSSLTSSLTTSPPVVATVVATTRATLPAAVSTTAFHSLLVSATIAAKNTVALDSDPSSLLLTTTTTIAANVSMASSAASAATFAGMPIKTIIIVGSIIGGCVLFAVIGLAIFVRSTKSVLKKSGEKYDFRSLTNTFGKRRPVSTMFNLPFKEQNQPHVRIVSTASQAPINQPYNNSQTSRSMTSSYNNSMDRLRQNAASPYPMSMASGIPPSMYASRPGQYYNAPFTPQPQMQGPPPQMQQVRPYMDERSLASYNNNNDYIPNQMSIDRYNSRQSPATSQNMSRGFEYPRSRGKSPGSHSDFDSMPRSEWTPRDEESVRYNDKYRNYGGGGNEGRNTPTRVDLTARTESNSRTPPPSGRDRDDLRPNEIARVVRNDVTPRGSSRGRGRADVAASPRPARTNGIARMSPADSTGNGSYDRTGPYGRNQSLYTINQDR